VTGVRRVAVVELLRLRRLGARDEAEVERQVVVRVAVLGGRLAPHREGDRQAGDERPLLDAVVVAVDVVVRVGHRIVAGAPRETGERTAAGEVAGVDHHDVVAGREVVEAVAAGETGDRAGEGGGEVLAGGRQAVVVGVEVEVEAHAVDAGLPVLRLETAVVVTVEPDLVAERERSGRREQAGVERAVVLARRQDDQLGDASEHRGVGIDARVGPGMPGGEAGRRGRLHELHEVMHSRDQAVEPVIAGTAVDVVGGDRGRHQGIAGPRVGDAVAVVRPELDGHAVDAVRRRFVLQPVAVAVEPDIVAEGGELGRDQAEIDVGIVLVGGQRHHRRAAGRRVGDRALARAPQVGGGEDEGGRRRDADEIAAGREAGEAVPAGCAAGTVGGDGRGDRDVVRGPRHPVGAGREQAHEEAVEAGRTVVLDPVVVGVDPHEVAEARGVADAGGDPHLLRLGLFITNCTRVRPEPPKFGVTLIAATSPEGLAGTVETNWTSVGSRSTTWAPRQGPEVLLQL
jgi:hypothetical protein